MTMVRNILTSPRLGQSISPASTNTNLISFMWLNLLLLIEFLVYYSLLPFLRHSSYHLCVPAVNNHSPISSTHMCFAKTKTLKSLRMSNQNQNLTTDLGFNWDDTCDYLTYDSIETLQPSKNDLRALHLNIRGLKGKMVELNNLLVNLKRPEVIILNETWLKEEDTKRINIPNYKYEGVPRTNKKGGGVGFLIRSDLTYRCRHDLESNKKNPACKHCYIEIKNN